MSEITLEKVDIIRERTGVSYAEAKDALEVCEGNVVDALIYIEANHKSVNSSMYQTKEELLNMIKEIVRKGNVTRIKIKKDDKVIVDVPVNAGVAVTGIIAILTPYLLAIGVVTAVVTKVTIEITKDDGTVEVVNKIIRNTVEDVKEKIIDLKDEVKEKFSHSEKGDFTEGNVYKYTVKFDDEKDENDNSDSKDVE
jgi:hypothetical protein